jgi:DNA-binding PadR family transcriptional regulator
MALSLKYVLLGMVVERAGYGYELQSRVEERLPFYNYTAGAVYPALDRLEQEQLIEASGEKRRRGTVRSSPRVMYSATAAGVTRLERWMYAPTSLENSRDALLAKLAIARPQDVPRLLEMASNQEAQLRQQLGSLQEAPAAAWTGRGRVPLPLVGAALVRSAEARRLSAAIESLQEVREALEHELRGARSPRETGRQPPR